MLGLFAPYSILAVGVIILECCQGICSVTNVKYMYITPYRVVGASDFICAYLCAYISHIYLSSIGIYAHFGEHICFLHLCSIMCEIKVTVGCVLAYIYKNVGSKYPFRVLDV